MSARKNRPEAADDQGFTYDAIVGTPEFISLLTIGSQGSLDPERVLSDEACAAVVGDREWFAEHPRRNFRLRFMARGEFGRDYPRAVVLVTRLRRSRKRFGNRLRRLLYTHWFANQPDPDTAPDDAMVRSLLIVQQAESRGTPLAKQTSPAAARVRLWLGPWEGRA